MTRFRVFLILALVLLSLSSFLQVARCQPDSDFDLVAKTVKEVGDFGVVGDGFQNFEGGNFDPASFVKTVCVFPRNPPKLVVAGEETEVLIGMKNEGEQSVNVLAVHASIHLPFDHRMLVQNLSAEAFNNASVPASVQPTFPYILSVSKFLQPGTFNLVGRIVYEVDQLQYQNIFYNGTIEVTEAGLLVSVETIFLISLGIALFVLFGLWAPVQMQNVNKKTKRVPKVELGTKSIDVSMDEWLQGTAYTQLQSSKLKNRK